MIFSVLSYFYSFNKLFFAVYSFVMVVLLLCSLFLRAKYKNECFNWIYIFNTLVAWLYCISLLIYTGELFMAWYGQNPYEWYAFSNPATFNSWKYFLLVSTITYLAGLLFFIRRLRINRLYIVFFLIAINFELIISLVTSFYRDYLPSSWSVYYAESITEKIIKWVSSLLILAITYWIAYKRKKLPYPSVFLK